jgi:pimeloyl-ACP methyl ester carboxylesterase
MDSSVRRRVMLASAAYAALLLASFAVRHIGARHEDVPPRLSGSGTNGGAREVSVSPQSHEGSVLALNGDVRIAYSEFLPEADAAMPILMIHGSPGHRQDFALLGPMLAERWRVIAPDLPGFGDSTHTLSDYSFRAHARYMLAMMDRLGIARAHLLGYSMGGGVVLNMIDLAPQRVASLTMLSAIGVQEMELTGSYYVNHLVHGVQLGGLLFLREATPHMGLFDGSMLGVEYARNFYDSDQRPLRTILQHVDVPALVLHGDRDPLVPPDAAIEHHRLLAQSELVMLASNHFMPFAEPALVLPPIRVFL